MPLSPLWEQTNVDALSLEDYVNIDQNISTSAPLTGNEIVNNPSNDNLSDEEVEMEIEDEISKIENMIMFLQKIKI